MEIDDLDGGVANTLADQSVMRGAEPKFVDCKSFDEAASAVTAWIKGLQESGIGSHEICFTPPNKVLVTALQSAGIKTLELQARQPDPGQDEPGVRYGTKQRIKGLEFKAVALLMSGHTSENQERYANYVAATRAREYLLIVDVK